MKSKLKLKWFTLIEMLIVMFIIWILSVVLVESYLTISRTALKIEQEKNLSEESLILTQTFQAISDEATIDYEAYSGYNLTENKWFTGVLYLTWWQRTWTKIYTTWENCLDLEWNFLTNDNWTYPDYSKKIRDALSWCDLVLEQWDWDQITSLLPNWKVVISSIKFKIIPYNSNDSYFESESISIQNDVHQPAFWLFIHLYSPLYQPVWTNKIDQPLQLFFNLNL